MKKIVSYLFIIGMLCSSIFANVNQHNKLVEEYLDVSGQEHIYSSLPTEMAQMVEQQFVAKGEKTPAHLEALLIEEFTRESTVEKLTENIQLLSNDTLMKLIRFYKSNVGKKCAAMNREEGMQDVQEKLPSFAQNLQENPPSKHRIDSMNTMFNETNILTGTLEMIESMIRIFDANAPKEQQMTEEAFNATISNMRTVIGNQLIITFYYSLRNFSDAEIDEVVKVTLSKEGQEETDAQISGLTAYFNLATNNIVKAVQK